MLSKVACCLLVICAASGVTGCSLFQEQADKAAAAAGQLVKGYCENTTADVRAQISTLVNERAAPHGVMVVCADE